MRKEVLESTEVQSLERVFFAFLLLFTAVILIIFLTLLRSGASRETFTGVIMYLSFALIIIGLVAFSLKKLKEGPKRASALAEETIIKGNSLVLPTELEIEYGTLTLRSHPEKRRSRLEFRPLKREKTSLVQFPREEFKILGTSSEGYAKFPAIRILEKRYGRSVLLFLTDEGSVIAKKLLSLSSKGESLDLEVDGRGKELRGRFYVPPGSGLRVEVRLSSPEAPEVDVKIAESPTTEFYYKLLPEEKIVIFAHHGALSLQNILRTLGIMETALGHGDFILRVTSQGTRRKILGEYTFVVKLKENYDAPPK